MGDVFDATATQGFRPDDPYPDGIYDCHLDYIFPSSSSGVFALQMTKIGGSNWHMTFSDVADDLEALWYAALWFEESAASVPEMDFEVYKFDRQNPGGRGALFLASRGKFAFALLSTANASNTQLQRNLNDGSTKSFERSPRRISRKDTPPFE